MVSLGGYNLRNFKKIQGEPYAMYQTQLYKGNRLVALVEDHGDKGLRVVLSSAFRSVRRNEFDFLLRDMETLISLMKPKMDKDALALTFLESTYMASVGFVELLIDLQELEQQYHEGIKKVEDNKYLALYQLGSSWFYTKDSEKPTTSLYFNTRAVRYETAYKRLKERIEKQKQRYGSSCTALLIKGRVNWNLSFKDYVKLHDLPEPTEV